jgi:hypothetical protein
MSLEGGRAPDRLREILEALSQYHQHILQEYTLQTQNPESLHMLEDVLEQEGKELLRRWNSKSFDVNRDTDTPALVTCITSVKKNINPWNPHISTLIPYWIDRMFFHSPFTISVDHIDRLHRNSQYSAEGGDDTDAEESSS